MSPQSKLGSRRYRPGGLALHQLLLAAPVSFEPYRSLVIEGALSFSYVRIDITDAFYIGKAHPFRV